MPGRFDQYLRGLIDPRGFLDRASRFAVGGTTAAGLLAALSPNFAQPRPAFADSDERIHNEWPTYEAALRGAGVHFDAFKYPSTQHGSNNDTTLRFDAKAAELAWGAHGGLAQSGVAGVKG